MNQLQNLSFICKLNQGCSPNFIQQNLNRNLSSLFNFMQTMKDLSAQQIKTKSSVDGKDLAAIIKSLAKILNKEQLSYQKHYVGSMCVFMSVINIPFFSKHLRLLDERFYNNLAPIFFDIINFWKKSQNSDDFAIARARLAAFARILTQIHKNKTSYLSKLFNQSLLNVIAQFQLPNDSGILRIIIKLFYQAQKFANQEQIKKIASQLYISFGLDKFPLKYMDLSIDFINSHLRLEDLSTFQQHRQILKNLKNIIKQNLSKNTQFINLNRVIYFISRISYYRNQSAFSLSQLTQFYQIVKKQKSDIKTTCLQTIAKYINVNEGKQNIDLLLNFLPTKVGGSLTGLQILQKIISNLSSASLIQLSQSDLLQRLINLVINKKENNLSRILSLRIFYALCCKMRDVNTLYYQQMLYSTKYMQQRVHSEENQTLTKALTLINQFTNKTVLQFYIS